jgi:type II restriction/modification system DNA methylase subunit YeeA
MLMVKVITASVGETFFIALYSFFYDITLNALRYQQFVKSITKSKFTLAALPPTSDAARYSLRTYHSILLWYNNSTRVEYSHLILHPHSPI